MVLPAIELIEIISARGNTTLQSTVEHAKQLQKEIVSVGKKLDPHLNQSTERLSVQEVTLDNENLIKEIELLIQKIERFVPYLNLIMTTSGANLNWSLPNSVSPSRFLQSSNLLSEANRKFTNSKDEQIRVGPIYKLKLYYMFTASVRPKSIKDFTWKEEFTKCDASLNRVREIEGKKKKKSKEFIYELVLIEDLNDGRYHEEFDTEDLTKQKETASKLGKPNETIPGKVLRIPVSDISRLYYTSSGSLLNIEESRSPVLVLKIIKGLSKSRIIKEGIVNAKDTDSNPLYVPPIVVTPEKRKKDSKYQMNAEFYALELFQESDDIPNINDQELNEENEEEEEIYSSGEEGEEEEETHSPKKTLSPIAPGEPETPSPRKVALPLTPTPSEPEYSTPSPRKIPLPPSPEKDDDSTISDESEDETNIVSRNNTTNTEGTEIQKTHDISNNEKEVLEVSEGQNESNETIENSMKTLSLLEFILRLSALEVSEQKSHLEVTDEKLNLFLRDEDSSGASAGSQTPESTPSKSTTRTSSPRVTPIKSSSLSSTRRRLFKDDIKEDYMDSPLANKMSNLKIK
jgi:hypothetical protein